MREKDGRKFELNRFAQVWCVYTVYRGGGFSRNWAAESDGDGNFLGGHYVIDRLVQRQNTYVRTGLLNLLIKVAQNAFVCGRVGLFRV